MRIYMTQPSLAIASFPRFRSVARHRDQYNHQQPVKMLGFMPPNRPVRAGSDVKSSRRDSDSKAYSLA